MLNVYEKMERDFEICLHMLYTKKSQTVNSQKQFDKELFKQNPKTSGFSLQFGHGEQIHKNLES